MCKRRRSRSGMMLYTDPGQSYRARRIFDALGAVLAKVSRPSRAEIEADDYDGSVPISRSGPVAAR